MLQRLQKTADPSQEPAKHPRQIVGARRPTYTTKLGAAYTANALAAMMDIETATQLVITLPPYALEFKEYGNVAVKEKYVDWFLPFASEIKRILKPQGSFVLNIGGSYRCGVTDPLNLSFQTSDRALRNNWLSSCSRMFLV